MHRMDDRAPQDLRLGDVSRWALDPTVAHLNHGSFAALTLETQRLVEEARRQVESNPMRFYAREAYAVWDRAARAAEDFLGAPVGRIALLTNATEGTWAVLQSLDWETGDVVVTTDIGYPAVDAQVAELVRRHGVEVRRVHLPLAATDDEVVELLADAAVGARLVVVDAISSAAGWVLPTERLVPAIRATGARVLVDAAHVPGQLPVDLMALAPDYWVGNFHKWACAPRGIAALYVHRDHVDHLRPLLPSVDTLDWDYPQNQRWRGTRDVGPLLVLPEVLATATWFTSRTVCRRNHDLVRTGARHVAAALGVAPVPLPACNMALVPVPTLPGDAHVARLLQADLAELLQCEVAVTVLDEDLYLRLSAHVYNTEDDFDRLASGVEPIVATMAKRLT